MHGSRIQSAMAASVPLATSFLLAASLLPTASPAWAQTRSPPLPDLPAELTPNTLTPFLSVLAKGVQIYLCDQTDGGTWSWVFKAPQAELFDTTGKEVGQHYAGPTWEGLDGAKVVGAVKASAEAPVPGAVPWLRLEVKSREGEGLLSPTIEILRVSTAGGTAPDAGCDEEHAGSELRVPYAASYFFLK